MPINRRRLLSGAAALPGTALIAVASDPALAAQAIDAAQFGVRAGASGDQSPALQRAIERAASTRTPLALGPGVYKAGDLKLPAGAQIVGVRGATKLELARGISLFNAEHADGVTLSGLVLDGGNKALPERRGLIHIASGRGIRIADCEVMRAGRHGIMLDGVEGQVTGTSVADAADTAIFSLNGRGVLLSGNIVRAAGNGGIRVWQSEKHDDGTIIADNRIEATAARLGGSGENGNAINIFRAANVIVRGNRIRDAAFSAIRGASASGIQIIGNNCGGLGEVALYVEFDFEGAVVAGNTVDGASIGVAVTNFNNGGRLATVQGNVLRNLTARRPAGTDPEDGWGIGIGVEADTAVTGNVIENAANTGIAVGWGKYQRDVNVSGNIVRGTPFGITASVAAGAGPAVIANNMISGARRGAIVGMEWKKAATGDLAKDGAGPHSHLSISGNQVR